MEKFDLAVFIGRFQPFHLGHLETVRHALANADKLLILVGSSGAATSSKNPFSYDERVAMIRASLTRDENFKVEMEPLRDHFYSDDVWVAEVQEKVSRYTTPNSGVCLVGRRKDASSYYLGLFPQWQFQDGRSTFELSATDVRQKLFHMEMGERVEYNVYQKDFLFNKLFLEVNWSKLLPGGVIEWLRDNYTLKAKYADNVAEYNQVRLYKDAWKDAPFPVTFVTVDTVVLSRGHVLLVKRKFNPGKGQLALPGGFVKQNELLIDAGIRELKEETGIRVGAVQLKKAVKESRVFDHPNRSLRGRTVTHAYCIRLDIWDNLDETFGLPELRAGSDASQVRWVPIAEALGSSDKFFEDHHAILSSFLVR